MRELKPCPFCGNDPVICVDDYGKYLIHCSCCDMVFGVWLEDGIELVDGWRATYKTEEEITAKWNHRVEGDATHDP